MTKSLKICHFDSREGLEMYTVREGDIVTFKVQLANKVCYILTYNVPEYSCDG